MMQVIPQWWWACQSTYRGEPHVDLDHWKLWAIMLMHYIRGAKCGIMVSQETNHLLEDLFSAIYCFMLSYIYMRKIQYLLSFSFLLFISCVCYNMLNGMSEDSRKKREVYLLHEVQNYPNPPLAIQVRKVGQGSL